MLLPTFASAALELGKVQVGKTSGTVTIIDGKQQSKPLATGAVFQDGNRVETGVNSTAELIFSNGSSLIVAPSTLLELRTFRQVPSADITDPYRKMEKDPSPSVTEIEISRGKVVGEVRKLNSLSTFTVKTPAGLVRIKGTVFTVEFRPGVDGLGQIIVNCIRGTVETTVYGSSAGAVTTPPGYQMTSTAPSQALIKEVVAVFINGIAPAGPSPVVTTTLTEPIKLILSLIPSEEFTALAALIETLSTLAPEVAYTITTMAQSAPTLAALNPTEGGGSIATSATTVTAGTSTTDFYVNSTNGLRVGQAVTVGGTGTITAILDETHIRLSSAQTIAASTMLTFGNIKLPVGAIVVIKGDEFAKAAEEVIRIAKGPTPPTSTTTGGNSDATKKVIDNVQRSVESRQTNPSGT